MIGIKDKKYIFWARRISDIDHITPIIYALIKNGVPSQLIRYIALIPDKTQKEIFDDPRIKFLKGLGVDFESLARNRFIHKIAFYQQKHLGNYFIRKIINEIHSRVFYRIIIFFFHLNIFFVSLKNKNNAIFILDHETIGPYNYAIKKAKKNNINIVTVPHGLVLHRGLTNRKHHELLFSKSSKLNIYDSIIIPNEIALSFHDLKEKKINLLGCPRYTTEWINKLSKIFKSAHEVRDESKINVLFFAEKSGQNIEGEWIPWINEDEIKKILKYLSDDPGINLIVKFHPSLSDTKFYNEYNCTKVIFDSQYNSFQLVKTADIVIATTTSALLDAFLLDKTVLIPIYASSFKLIFSNYDIHGTVSSYEAFIKNIEYSKKKVATGKGNCESYKLLLKDLKLDKKSNVLNDYYNLLNGFQNNM